MSDHLLDLKDNLCDSLISLINVVDEDSEWIISNVEDIRLVLGAIIIRKEPRP